MSKQTGTAAEADVDAAEARKQRKAAKRAAGEAAAEDAPKKAKKTRTEVAVGTDAEVAPIKEADEVKPNKRSNAAKNGTNDVAIAATAAEDGTVRKKKHKNQKARTGKMRRDRRKLRLETSQKPGAVGAEADIAPHHGTQESEMDAGDLDRRVFVKGLPHSTTEKKVRKFFAMYGKVKSVRLILNTRLVFKGSAFIVFDEEDGATSALEAAKDAVFEGEPIQVAKAAAPITQPNLKVYIGNLPREADEKTLRKDFAECGEIARMRMLQDGAGKFTGAAFITYASKAGVEEALKFDGTDYCGRTLGVSCAAPKQKVEHEALEGFGKAGKGAGKGKSKGKTSSLQRQIAIGDLKGKKGRSKGTGKGKGGGKGRGS